MLGVTGPPEPPKAPQDLPGQELNSETLQSSARPFAKGLGMAFLPRFVMKKCHILSKVNTFLHRARPAD